MRTRVFDGKGGVAVCSYLGPSLRRPRRVFCFCAARQMRTGVFNGKGGAAVCRRKADGVADERRRQKNMCSKGGICKKGGGRQILTVCVIAK